MLLPVLAFFLPLFLLGLTATKVIPEFLPGKTLIIGYTLLGILLGFWAIYLGASKLSAKSISPIKLLGIPLILVVLNFAAQIFSSYVAAAVAAVSFMIAINYLPKDIKDQSVYYWIVGGALAVVGWSFFLGFVVLASTGFFGA